MGQPMSEAHFSGLPRATTPTNPLDLARSYRSIELRRRIPRAFAVGVVGVTMAVMMKVGRDCVTQVTGLARLLSVARTTCLASVLPVAILLTFVSCGDVVNPPPAPPPLPPLTVGPAGGTVVAADGDVVLVFPPGAVSQFTTITVQRVQDATKLPQPIQGPVFDFGPDGIVFKAPATLTIGYDPSELPPGVTEARLGIYKLENDHPYWDPVSAITVDLANHTVSGAIDGFTWFTNRERAENPRELTREFSHGSGPLQSSAEVGVWMFKPDTLDLDAIADWLWPLRRELWENQRVRIREPINVVWIDHASKNRADAQAHVEMYLTAAGFFQELATNEVRKHGPGYFGFVNDFFIAQSGENVSVAWVDAEWPAENVHGRIFPVANVGTTEDPVFYTLGAFSREGEALRIDFHRFLSFDGPQRQVLGWKTIGETVHGWKYDALDAGWGNILELTTADHQGVAILVRGGKLIVEVSATGENLDQVFIVVVDAGTTNEAAFPVAANAIHDLGGFPAGTHVIELTDVAANCTVPMSQEVELANSTVDQVVFNVICDGSEPGTPDLTVSASVASSYLSEEANVQIPMTVTRSGGNLSEGTYVTARLYWSVDAQWDAADTQLWESDGSTPDFPNDVLNEAGTKTVTATVNIPALSAGGYSVLAVVDPTNFHPESDESNNISAYAITLIEPPPNPPGVVWTGDAGSGLWGDLGNWDKGRVPGPADTAYIALDGAAVTLDVSATVLAFEVTGNGSQLVHNANTLQIDSSATFGPAATYSLGRTDAFISGTLGGAGTVSVQGAFEWTGGRQAGTGTTILASGATVTWSGAEKHLDERKMVNDAVVAWSLGNFVLSRGAQFVNNGTLEWVGTGPGTLFPAIDDGLGAVGTVTNNGVFRNTTSATVQVWVTFDNNGSVAADLGTIHFIRDGTHAGDFTLASGTTLRFAWTVGWPLNTHIFRGAVRGPGTVDLGGAMTFESGSTLDVSALVVNRDDAIVNGVLRVADSIVVDVGGSLELETPATAIVVPRLILESSGLIGGSDSLVVTERFRWVGGTLVGPGVTWIRSTATGSWGVITKTLEGRTLVNDASNTAWSGGTISLSNAAALVNNGVIDQVGALAGQIDAGSGGGGSFTNQGTLRKSTSTSTSISVPFVNHGVLDLIKGSLAVQGAYEPGSSSTLAIGLGGVTAGTEYGRLAVRDAATLTGTLGVSLVGGFAPSLGDEFVVLTFGTVNGDFQTVNLPPLPDGLAWEQPRFTAGNMVLSVVAVWDAPPFAGTAFISPDIITSSDPTAFESVTATGQGTRLMFDRRVNDWITVDAHLFDATFDDGLKAEIQVNPEFDFESAQAAAEKYGGAIGRLPAALRLDVETVWIHQGIQPFGGGNRNILIHLGQAQLYEGDGVLEEILLHEAVHTSLDASHAAAPGWLAAQAADPTFISTYAREKPDREDLAESFGPWFAVRYRQSRIAPSLASVIQEAIPHRLQYLDAQGCNLYPLVPSDITSGSTLGTR